MQPKFVIKIRWNCGTERYVTGYGDGRSVKWDSAEPAMVLDNFEYASSVCNGLNFNHISSDLGGFACVVAVDPEDIDRYVNPSLGEEEDNENWRLIKLRDACANHEAE
jgi:hypothetical protein